MLTITNNFTSLNLEIWVIGMEARLYLHLSTQLTTETQRQCVICLHTVDNCKVNKFIRY